MMILTIVVSTLVSFIPQFHEIHETIQHFKNDLSHTQTYFHTNCKEKLNENSKNKKNLPQFRLFLPPYGGKIGEPSKKLKMNGRNDFRFYAYFQFFVFFSLLFYFVFSLHEIFCTIKKNHRNHRTTRDS